MSKLSKEFLEEYYSKGRQDFIDNNFIELQNILVEIKRIQKKYKNQCDASTPLTLELTLMLNQDRHKKAKAIVKKRIGQNFKSQQDFINNNFIELQKIFVNIKEIRKRYINQRHPLSLLCLEISLMLSFKYDEKTESIVEGIIGENLN